MINVTPIGGLKDFIFEKLMMLINGCRGFSSRSNAW
jgi:hypothetical protein